MSQVEHLDKILEEGKKSVGFFHKRDFSTESPGFYDHLRIIAKMAYHAFDIMEPVAREWAEFHDEEEKTRVSSTSLPKFWMRC